MKYVSSYYEDLITSGSFQDCIVFSYHDNSTTPNLNFICTDSDSLSIFYFNIFLRFYWLSVFLSKQKLHFGNNGIHYIYLVF